MDFEKIKIDLFTDLLSKPDFANELRSQGIDPKDPLAALNACGINQNPSRIRDFDLLQIARKTNGDYWLTADNTLYGIFKETFYNKATTSVIIGNSDYQEMFNIPLGKKDFETTYPKLLMKKRKDIYDVITASKDFYNNKWYGWHVVNKFLATKLYFYFEKGIETLISIATEKGFCQNHCYKSMLQFKEFLESKGIKVKIFLRNEYSISEEDLEQDGVQAFNLPYFLDVYVRELSEPRK